VPSASLRSAATLKLRLVTKPSPVDQSWYLPEFAAKPRKWRKSLSGMRCCGTFFHRLGKQNAALAARGLQPSAD
jgi:hypothetical protein